MLSLVSYVVVGLVIGLFTRGFIVSRPFPSVAFSEVWGAVGALAVGWFGKMMNWYDGGAPAGLMMAAAGAVVVELIAYDVYRRNQNHKYIQR